LVTKYGMVAEIESPGQSRRYMAILIETLATVILPLVLIISVAFILVSNAQFTRELESNFMALALAMIQFVLITGLARVSLTSHKPQWRIISFTNESAANLEGAIRLFAIILLIVSMSMVLVNPSRSEIGALRILNFVTTAESIILISTAGLLLVAVFALNVLRSRNWRLYRRVEGDDDKTEQPAPFNVRLLFNLARGLIVFGVIAYLVGYLNLGLYIASRTILTLCYVAIVLLLHGLVREGLNQATSADNPVGRRVRDRFALQDVGASRWVFWLIFLVDVLLAIALILLLLLVWGVPWAEITPVFTTLVYGTDIGGHTFSLISIGIALGAFILLMLVVKLLQGFLSKRILVQTRLDVGVRDAVTAGVGYAGVVIAVLVALSLMGLEFGEIAIVFGALSIGIGFGLQGIVNNFISGLVLLVQRPIKAGDWIVVGQNQGYVKRVSVISTMITTFDNATVIVPNSQLMTTEVINWSHGSRLGRVKVPVGVSYATDPEQVRTILLECAEENSTVLSRPAPQVRFMAFGESSLDFELRVYIRDIDYTLVVASELRFAIKKALDEAGIEIPFPQRDLHVKDLPDTARGLPAQGISD
ncbi:mechanosensitive ion channel, partial [Gammaproteobacteria bacterium]|nr:mechanosensitive ion channel [Gammaproteobacteria bacterium]